MLPDRLDAGSDLVPAGLLPLLCALGRAKFFDSKSLVASFSSGQVGDDAFEPRVLILELAQVHHVACLHAVILDSPGADGVRMDTVAAQLLGCHTRHRARAGSTRSGIR